MGSMTSCPALRVQTRGLIALVGVMAALFAPLAGAEIYKCVTKNGLPLYQNFPCDVDSLGSWSSMMAAANASALNRADKGPAVPPATNQKRAQAGEPSVGMTSDEVTALLGEPVERIADEPAEGGPISIWHYADGRSVQFDRSHRVFEIQR